MRSGRTVYQRSDQRCTGGGAGGLAAGENGVKSQLAGCFQGSKGVPADIKSPVQGQRHRSSGLLSGLFCRLTDGGQRSGVQIAFRGQYAGHDAVGACFHQGGGLLGHLVQFIAVVAEIAKPGAQQRPHRQAGLRFDLPHQRQAGGGAANDQVGAQLQPAGSALFGGQGAGCAVYTYFQDRTLHGCQPSFDGIETARLPVFSGRRTVFHGSLHALQEPHKSGAACLVQFVHTGICQDLCKYQSDLSCRIAWTFSGFSSGCFSMILPAHSACFWISSPYCSSGVRAVSAASSCAISPFKRLGSTARPITSIQADVLLFDVMELGMGVEYAKRMLGRGDVVAQHQVQLELAVPHPSAMG